MMCRIFLCTLVLLVLPTSSIAVAQAAGSVLDRTVTLGGVQKSANSDGGQETAQQKSLREIKIMTPSGEYPIRVDDKPMGETSATGRKLLLEEGSHKIEVQFPAELRWSYSITVSSVTQECQIQLDYQPGPSLSIQGTVTSSVLNCGNVENTERLGTQSSNATSSNNAADPSAKMANPNNSGLVSLPGTRCTRLTKADCVDPKKFCCKFPLFFFGCTCCKH